MIDYNAPPIENKIIRLRAYLDTGKAAQERKRIRPLPPSEFTLIFDTETRTDPGQHLRFGAYQLRKGKILLERGWFYEPATTSPDDLACLEHTCELEEASASERVLLMTRDDFVENIFFDRAWKLGARIVGINLPFDISRLAIEPASPARGRMRGGFSFKLSANPKRPRVRVRSLSRHMSFFDISARPPRKEEGAPRMLDEPGFFVDLKTLAFALMAESHSLKTLSKSLKVPTPKEERDDHGGALTQDYICYAARDVQTTWECYAALSQSLQRYGVNLEAHETYSGASLGKAHLRAMNIKPWRVTQQDFPPELIGKIMSAYYGGRSEVHIRRVSTRAVLCDFRAMYPTVSTLMRTWEFLTAEGVDSCDDTDAVKDLVEGATLEALGRPEAWRNLASIVLVRPREDVFPVRTSYGNHGETASTIGLNYLTADEPLWFTLADVLVSKLFTGRAPRIQEAIRFTPRRQQRDLCQLALLGDHALTIDPADSDFFKALIELREKVRGQLAADQENDALKAQEKALKVLANATGYGVFVELNVNGRRKEDRLRCYSGDVEFEVADGDIEKPGEYFHPIVGALITGAARLMLTLAERQAEAQGLGWVFCDTNSLALARPTGMTERDFLERVRNVVDWFGRLNPYSFGGSILQIEKVNYTGEKAANGFEPIHCLAISAKRTALYVKGSGGKIDIRKASAHGLGHLMAPYPDADDGKRRGKIKVAKWQEELWIEIIRAAEGDEPDTIAWERLEGFKRIAGSQYAATRPQLLQWFDRWNEGRPFAEQIKAFNFLLSLQLKSGVSLAAHDSEIATALRDHGRPAPAAPFNKDLADAADNAFDRKTGKRVPPEWLEDLLGSLEDYHLHPEAKFWNGDWYERGVLRRRHIHARAVELIGKETDDLEVVEFVQEEEPGLVFGVQRQQLSALNQIVLVAAKQFGYRALCRRAAVRHHNVTALQRGEQIELGALRRLFEASEALRLEALTGVTDEVLLVALRDLASEVGLGEAARRLNEDRSNLHKMIYGKRRLSRRVRLGIGKLVREARA